MTDRISVFKSAPATTFVLEADVVDQNVAGNYSVVRCYLRATNGPGGSTGSFSNDPGVQSGSIDGIGEFGRVSGNPFLPSGYANGQQRWRGGNYDVVVYHNPDGTRGPITLRQGLVYGTNINESSTAQLSFATIPKPPGVPTGLALTSPAPSKIQATWVAPGNGGSAITGYRLRVDDNDAFASPEIINTGTTALTRLIESLAPGKRHYVQVAATNAYGTGAYSAAQSLVIGVGGKHFIAGLPQALAIARRRSAGAWVELSIARRFQGGSWVDVS